jgi:hypothetical protein
VTDDALADLSDLSDLTFFYKTYKLKLPKNINQTGIGGWPLVIRNGT